MVAAAAVLSGQMALVGAARVVAAAPLVAPLVVAASVVTVARVVATAPVDPAVDPMVATSVMTAARVVADAPVGDPAVNPVVATSVPAAAVVECRDVLAEVSAALAAEAHRQREQPPASHSAGEGLVDSEHRSPATQSESRQLLP